MKMNLSNIGYELLGWVHLLQDRDQWKAKMNFRVPQNSENFLSCWATIGFSRLTQLHGFMYHIKISISDSGQSFWWHDSRFFISSCLCKLFSLWTASLCSIMLSSQAKNYQYWQRFPWFSSVISLECRNRLYVINNVVPILNYAPRHDHMRECRRTHIPNLGTRLRWLASFTPRPLYCREVSQVPIKSGRE
jgi:hypothetical protein